MNYKGTVKNGVVVLEPDANLPEGISVRVEPDRASKEEDADLDPAFKVGDLSVDCGIPDLAVNLDHYLYGHPKATDVE